MNFQWGGIFLGGISLKSYTELFFFVFLFLWMHNLTFGECYVGIVRGTFSAGNDV